MGDRAGTAVRLSGVGLGITGASFAAATAAAGVTHSFAAAAVALHLALATAVWLANLVHAARSLAAEREALEADRGRRLGAEGRRQLFEGRAPGERAEARTALRRFEGVGSAAVALAIGVAGLLGAVALLRWFPLPDPQATLPWVALLGGCAFAALVVGRYAVALGELPTAGVGARRAASSALLLLIAALALAGQAAWGLRRADLVGYALAAIELLLGFEALLLVLLDLYRPRRAGERPRPPYDSRLLGIIGSPGDLARSIAHAVDYQFGFSFSQTWLYRFAERWIAPLVAFTGVAFWLLSVGTVVAPGERGVLRRLGTTQPEPLPPGLHLTLPWPFDRVEQVPTERVRTVGTGDHVGAHDDGVRQPSLLWADGTHVDEHGKGGRNLVLIARASAGAADAERAPVNLLAASASLFFVVDSPRRFATTARDPEALLQALAERELCSLFGGEDLDVLLRTRGAYAERLQTGVTARAKALGLGVHLRGASLTDLHPPAEVSDAFEAVTRALERRQAAVRRAEVEAIRIAARSETLAARDVSEARTGAEEREALAKADADRFAAQRGLDDAAQRLFRAGRLLDALVRGVEGSRVVVVGRPDAVTTDLDLQERVSVEELGLGQEVLQSTCPTCDAPVQDDWETCPRCGTRLEEE